MADFAERECSGDGDFPGASSPRSVLSAIPERPAADALVAAMDCAAAGRPFCIHPAGVAVTGHEAPEHFQCVTSGSTGTPRRIRRHQATWVHSFVTNTGLFDLTDADSYACLGSMSASLTLYAACEALHVGADLNLLDRMRPDRQMQALSKRRVTVLYATPTQIRLLSGPPCPGMRLVLVGGGALDAETARHAARQFPNARIHAFYGASEASFITVSDADTPIGSVGRSYPGVQVTIRDAQARELPAGQTGEIWVESPTLFAGYAGDQTGGARRSGAALTVGEHGHLDTSGHLWVSGRGDRMFQVADQPVHPEEIETWLLSLPGIAQAAVLPRPDAQRGQVPIALVSGTSETQWLLTRARKALGPIKAPRAVIRIDDWPLLPSGKTDLRALEALL